MGIFDKLKKNKKEIPTKGASERNCLVTISMAISNDDAQVRTAIEACISKPEAYLEEHKVHFEERGMKVEEESFDTLQWIAMVDILEEYGYVCERDWDDELVDFVYFVEKLKGVVSRDLFMDSEWFDEDGDITSWCSTLDEKWSKKGICMAAISIESDSYVLFPYEVKQLMELRRLAERIEQNIDMAKNM